MPVTYFVSVIAVRPPFKMLFLVQRLGEDITADWELFFSFCHFFYFFFNSQKFQYFLTHKKKEGGKRYCGHPTGHNFGHLLDRKHTFLRVALLVYYIIVNCMAMADNHIISL